MVSIEPEWQTAVSAALGAATEALAVCDLSVALGVFERLKSGDLGRAGMLLGDAPDDGDPWPALPSGERWAIDVVKADSALRPGLRRLLRCVAVVDDITAAQSLVTALPEVTAVTTALNQLVSRLNLTLDRERLFTADVAHELRTPLAGLRLHLELLAKVHGMGVDPLIQRLDQMTTSISQLLQLARVGQSFSAGSYQQVLLLDDVVKPLQDELEAMLAQRQQRLLLTDIENEAVVSGDATLIRVILRNLVENAHRYSPEGSTIRVSVKAGLMPVMAVEDEGPGIDEAKSGELSKAFVRMDSRYGGIGLGLSIVTRIAQLHDAQFFLHNRQPGPGVRAWVLFPQRGGQNVSTH